MSKQDTLKGTRFIENVACMTETLAEARLLISSGQANAVLSVDPPKAVYKNDIGHEERDLFPGTAVNVRSLSIVYTADKKWGLYSHGSLDPAVLWQGMSDWHKLNQVLLLALMSKDADFVSDLIEGLKPIAAMLRKNA